MDAQTFTALVSGSPLIPAELKTKLLAEAAGYSPEKREQIAATIRKSEGDFLTAAKIKQAEITAAETTAAQAKLAALHKEEAKQHATEEQMLATLEADIATM